jgi:hypothetical protein
MPYFYKRFFQELGAQQLMFNFASFFHEGTMYTISEHLPNGLNFNKGLLSYTEEDLRLMTSKDLLSKAIVLSMILLPAEIKLQDIIIVPSKVNFGEVLVIDWHSFFNKNFMHKRQDSVQLNTHNSLFVLDFMSEMIDPSVVKKFAEIDVLKVCETVFMESKLFSESVQELCRKP